MREFLICDRLGNRDRLGNELVFDGFRHHPLVYLQNDIPFDRVHSSNILPRLVHSRPDRTLQVIFLDVGLLTGDIGRYHCVRVIDGVTFDHRNELLHGRSSGSEWKANSDLQARMVRFSEVDDSFLVQQVVWVFHDLATHKVLSKMTNGKNKAPRCMENDASVARTSLWIVLNLVIRIVTLSTIQI